MIHQSHSLSCVDDDHRECLGHLTCVPCMAITGDEPGARFLVPCECECHYDQWLKELEVVVTKSLNAELLAIRIRIDDDGRLLCGMKNCVAPGIRLASVDAHTVNDLLGTLQAHRVTYHPMESKPRRRPRGISPISGKTAMEIATRLLADPDVKLGQKDIAADILRSPAGMSMPILNMKASSLVTDKGLPVVPDLFWELAERWREETNMLPALYVSAFEEIKAAHDALDNKSLDVPGIARVDAAMARIYDPNVNTDQISVYPDILVPENLFPHYSGMCSYGASEEEAVARLRVAPIRTACWDRVPVPRDFIPATKLLFVALELAQSKAGRAVLQGWTPQKPAGHRVW